MTLILIYKSLFYLSLIVGLIFFSFKFKNIFNLNAHPGKRRIHKKKIPLFGGPIIAISFLAILLLEVFEIQKIEKIISYSIIFFMIGLIDDLKHLNFQNKLIMLIISFIFVYKDISFDGLGNYEYFGYLDFGNLRFILNIILFLFLINAYNYADGVDGNAILLFISSILLIGLFTNFSYYEINYIIFLLGLILFPILIINLNLIKNYQFFLGNSGSFLLGFVLSAILIFIAKWRIVHPILLAWSITILTYDCIDVTLRRLIKKKNIFGGDNIHLHHIFYKKFNHKLTSLFIFCINNIFGIIGFAIYKFLNASLSLIFFIMAFIFYYKIKSYFLKKSQISF